MLIAIILLCLSIILRVSGHGSMIEPPARATMHDYGFPENPKDYQWMEGFCGGKGHQWSSAIGGKCGICGDAWDAVVKEHEAPGGKFANGVIVRQYQPGQVITVTSHITANHAGYVEVRLCRNNNINQDPGQECFDQTDAALTVVETGDTKFWITDAMGANKISAQFRLPMWTCDQCVLQWTYRNGRDWGTCNGACGAVETFKACADIAIVGEGVTTVTQENNNNNESTENNESTTETVTESTTTEASIVTSPVPGGDTCRGTGAWTGNSATDAWCQVNCNNDPPYCPGSVCSCDSDNNVPSNGQWCFSVGAWAGNQAVSQWCQHNCPAGFCPTSMCQCFIRSRSSHGWPNIRP